MGEDEESGGWKALIVSCPTLSLLCLPFPPTWHSALTLQPRTPAQTQDAQALSVSPSTLKSNLSSSCHLAPTRSFSLPGKQAGFRLSPLRSPLFHFAVRIPIHVCLSLPKNFPNPIGRAGTPSSHCSLVLYGHNLESPSPTTPWRFSPFQLSALSFWLLQSCHLIPLSPQDPRIPS